MTLRLTLLFATLALVGLLIVACGQTRRGGGTACFDATECSSESGELETCIDGYCKAVECLSSSDCPLDNICDVEDDDYECKEGCNADSDCRAGKTCDDGQCQEYGCRSTVLDCPRGHFCDEDSGDCYEAEGAYCTECNLADNDWDLGETTACDDQLLGNDFCGGDGSYCVNFVEVGTPTCFVSCDQQEDCPAGYTCQAVLWGLPAGCSQDYIQLETVCISDCSPD